MFFNENTEISIKNISDLIVLDERGIFPREGETIKDFERRVSAIQCEINVLDKAISRTGDFLDIGGIKISEDLRIPEDHMQEASSYVERYAFSITWVPAFYNSKSLPPLCGGCSMVTCTGLPFFILKAVFKSKKRWLIYDRNELIAHELCHIARTPIEGKRFEELMAYKISPSFLRRYLGSCFRSGIESFFLIMPVFLLIIAQILQNTFFPELKIIYFIVLTVLYPVFLLTRDYADRKTYSMAERNLYSCFQDKKVNTDAVLFRCTEEEIRYMATLENNGKFLEWVVSKGKTNLRWEIIKARFLA